MEGSEVGATLLTTKRAATISIRNRRIFDESRNSQPPDGDFSVAGRGAGSGGEIRDEGATGRGAKPKLVWSVSPFPTCEFLASNNRGRRFR